MPYIIQEFRDYAGKVGKVEFTTEYGAQTFASLQAQWSAVWSLLQPLTLGNPGRATLISRRPAMQTGWQLPSNNERATATLAMRFSGHIVESGKPWRIDIPCAELASGILIPGTDEVKMDNANVAAMINWIQTTCRAEDLTTPYKYLYWHIHIDRVHIVGRVR